MITTVVLSERLTKKKVDKLENLNIPSLDKVLVCSNSKFTEDDYYDEENYTKIKMQIFYFEGNIDRNIKCSWYCGYTHAYVFDLKNKTYKVIA